MIFMEMHEKKIPLQRVSVHNVHADKNYLAIKYNPVGFMALMFGSAIFMTEISPKFGEKFFRL